MPGNPSEEVTLWFSESDSSSTQRLAGSGLMQSASKSALDSKANVNSRFPTSLSIQTGFGYASDLFEAASRSPC